MKLDNINRWLTLIANFGIVTGLGLLVLEVNHATRLADTEAYVSRTQAIGDHLTQLALSPDLAEIFEKLRRDGLGSLTAVERSRVASWEVARMYRIDGQYYEYQQGFLDKAAIDAAIRGGAVPRAQLWRDLGIVIENEEFKSALEQVEAELAE